jgi:predicted nucleotide-binding protein
LGREKVCALVQGDVETPNDISGVVYIPLDTHEAWKMKVAKELKAAGYTVDMNRL